MSVWVKGDTISGLAAIYCKNREDVRSFGRSLAHILQFYAN